MDRPEIRFFQSPTGHRVAYASHGRGPLLVCGAWWVSHVEKDWDQPEFRRFFSALGQHRRVIRYDRPGSGLSDRARDRVDVEGEAETLAALLEQLGEAPVDLFALSCAGPAAIMQAARRPERVRKLVLFGSFLEGARVGKPELRDAMMGLVRAHWGLGSRTIADLFAPDLGREAAARMGRAQKAMASPDMAAALLALTFDASVTELAAQVPAEALVLHRQKDMTVPFDAGAELAAALPNARLQPLEGTAHVPWLGDSEAALAAIGAFLDFDHADPRPTEVAAATTAFDGDDELLFRREGDVWLLRFAGRSAHVKHGRGLSDLSMLLSAPGQEIPALQLFSEGADVGNPAPSASPTLDEQAIAAYRERVRELDADIAARQAAGDPDGAERLRDERDAIAHELSAGLGLGGRRRRMGDDQERARKAVSARVRASIVKIGRVHPELGEHLQQRVTTGNFLVYAGDPEDRFRT